MKKFFIGLTLLLLSTAAFSQNFGGGLYIGMSTSQIDGDGLRGFDLPGLNIGAFTDINLNSKSKLQLELAFIQKGARELPSDTSNFYRARLNYIEVPLLYIYRWKKLSIEIGPAFDLLVSSTEEQNGVEFEGIEFDSFNLVGIFGVQWHFTENWSVDFRSNTSISPIREGRANTGRPFVLQLGGDGQRNIVLSFAVNYRFR